MNDPTALFTLAHTDVPALLAMGLVAVAIGFAAGAGLWARCRTGRHDRASRED